MASCKQGHVVAVPLAGQGHLNPLMRFCKVLASHGVLVTFVNIDPVHHRIEELMRQQDQAAAAAQDTHAPQIRRAHVPIQGLDLANDFRVSVECVFEAQKSIASPLEALIVQLNLQGPPVTCLISDIGMTFPTQDVADKLKIPRVVLFPSSPSGLLLVHSVTKGRHNSMQEVLEKLSRRALTREVVCEGQPGLPTIYNNEAFYFKHVLDGTAYMWEFMKRACEVCFHRAHAVVFNSFDDLEAPALNALSNEWSLPMYAVGPLVQPLHEDSSTSLWKEDEACMLWLDQHPPLSVLYISFGSVTLLTQTQFDELLTGLVSSNQRFLWVFRPDLVENVPSSTTLIPHILSRSHGKGYVVDWAPQLRVLSHPSIGGFLTHCGWNSTIEAIFHGVPMLCWPYVADQFLDAKYIVEEWKVGLLFEGSKERDGLIRSCEVARVIKALMEGKEGEALRNNAMRLKEASRKSLLPGSTSNKNIQTLINSFMLQTTENSI